ncbi:toll/interleukin-1 receptor domain-containing protein [Candidatus Chloroploca sp. M-50]|uniref:Toll/interleukin-1 receptor domain-containing protein n=1 Tax=Candidatus Chloroploca mongolica TaxID=2528176 RepID=A0ABS4D9U2_9CHLR|nr:toll/interleukin-1 receptor domain-containing protein [Candidatus Chloroploca mongolica]MBP1466197.1 toll/interleukin-1 receptor domain-containing protein [Candidatus Chloroploca mongolica]
MAQLFLIATPADATCTDALRDLLTAQGYGIWSLPAHLDSGSASYPSALERGIRGSAALVLIWSAAAAGDEWVERMVRYGQQLKKPVITLARDATPLPITLVDAPGLRENGDLAAAVTRLVPLLPPPEQDDLLLALLSHEYIREQKRGIAEAVTLIQRGERREELLAMLEDLARHSLYNTVAAEAQQALASLSGQPAPEAPPAASRHTFGVRCPKGHVSWYDKREVCPASGTIPRSTVRKAGQDLDELLLPCRTAGCTETVVVRVDCEGYT